MAHTHENHDHKHGPACGHTAIKHDGHTDYLHDGHLHHQEGGKVEEHQLAVTNVNPDGGAIARGHPFAASSSVLVTRLFTRMARGESEGPKLGVATLGVAGGMGLAALFEAV